MDNLKRKWRILVCLYLMSYLGRIDGYAAGGPGSKNICTSMTPNHGEDPQSTKHEYSVLVEASTAKGGEPIDIKISSPDDDPFKGFYVQGRKVGSEEAVGSFSANSNEIKLLDCLNLPNSSVTHTNSRPKTVVNLKWTPPNEEGNYVILSTFVKDAATYWVKVPSKHLTVKRNVAAPVQTNAEKVISRQLRDKLVATYKDCGKGAENDGDKPKGCFGIPQNCIQNFQKDPSKNPPCDIMTSYRVDGEKYSFEIVGKSNGYVANGLSTDNLMGEDSVVICRRSDSNVKIYSAYNELGIKNNVPHNNEAFGLTDRNTESSEFIEGYIMCKFTRTQIADLTAEIKKKFDLNEKYNILVAEGQNTNNHIDIHGEKGVSSPVYLTDIGIAGAKSDILYRLHGSFMIIAWLLCASSGMFTARYYKHTHTGYSPFGKAFWFVVHLMCMFSTAILTIAGSVVIFVEKDGKWAKETGSDAHPILGAIVTGLAILQVLIAFFRPAPRASKRKLFNWVHWCIGNCAHILAIVTIFLSQTLNKTGLKDKNEFLYVLLAFVAFHCLFHIIMSIHTVLTDKRMDTRDKRRGFRPGPLKPSGMDADEEAPGTGFRTFMLTSYMLGSAGVAVALIIFYIQSI